MAGSYGDSIFSFLRNYQLHLHHLISSLAMYKNSVFPHPCQHLLFFFIILYHPVRCEVGSHCSLICTSLMTNGAEQNLNIFKDML